MRNRIRSLVQPKLPVSDQKPTEKPAQQIDMNKTADMGGLPQLRNTRWFDIIKYDVTQYELEQNKVKQAEVVKKRRNHEELERQLAESKQKKETERLMEMELYKQQLGKLDEEERNEKRKEEEIRKRIKDEKKVRDNQLKEAEERKKAMKEERILNEKKLLDKLHHELTEEETKLKAKKESDLSVFSKILRENQIYKEQLKVRKMQEKKNDAIALEEYSRFLEKEETKRMRELKVREDRLQKFMNVAAQTVVKKEKNKLREEELIHLKYINEKDRKEEDEEKRKKAIKTQKERMLVDGMKQQITEKVLTKTTEKAKDSQYLNEWIKSTDKIFAEDKKRWEEYHKKELNNLTELKKQMEIKARKDSNGLMDDREQNLNKALVSKINV